MMWIFKELKKKLQLEIAWNDLIVEFLNDIEIDQDLMSKDLKKLMKRN